MNRLSRIADWCMEHLSVVVLVLGLIAWAVFLGHLYSSPGIAEWGKQPVSSMTKGDVLLMVCLGGWVINLGRGK